MSESWDLGLECFFELYSKKLENLIDSFKAGGSCSNFVNYSCSDCY